MNKIQFHSFHIVSLSPWPFLRGLFSLIIISRLVLFFKFSIWLPFVTRLVLICFISFFWWRDVVRERLFLGDHTDKVQDGLKWGISFFILREGLFFIAWFWAFFHSSRVPVNELGLFWPPILIRPFNPFSIPLVNTAILLTRGVFVTWSHHRIISEGLSFYSLLFTILLGLLFTIVQLFEYLNSSFNIRDRSYGTTFFVRTGFHGVHVIVGRIFLFVCLYRIFFNHFSITHIVGFEFSIWYWHFVDVIWLFLFTFIYWWGWE